MTALFVIAVSLFGISGLLELVDAVEADTKEERAWAVIRACLMGFAIVCAVVWR